MHASNDSNSGICRRNARVRAAAVALICTVAVAATGRAEAGSAEGEPGHFGLVVDSAAEFGGDNLVKVIYRDGSTQHITAGGGVTLGVGVHYRPESFPVDFAATVGYKIVRTSSYHTDLGVDRVVIKLTGTYSLSNHFWVTAGPVWHTATKLNGDGYIQDVNFDDSVGGMVGVGWRWIGVSYTNMKYRGPFSGSVDASSGGLTFAWKF